MLLFERLKRAREGPKPAGGFVFERATFLLLSAILQSIPEVSIGVYIGFVRAYRFLLVSDHGDVMRWPTHHDMLEHSGTASGHGCWTHHHAYHLAVYRKAKENSGMHTKSSESQ